MSVWKYPHHGKHDLPQRNSLFKVITLTHFNSVISLYPFSFKRKQVFLRWHNILFNTMFIYIPYIKLWRDVQWYGNIETCIAVLTTSSTTTTTITGTYLYYIFHFQFQMTAHCDCRTAQCFCEELFHILNWIYLPNITKVIEPLIHDSLDWNDNFTKCIDWVRIFL